MKGTTSIQSLPGRAAVGAMLATLILTTANAETLIGGDFSNTDNDFIQPSDPALSGGGRDQTQRFGDNLPGTGQDDVLIGALGTDGLFGFGGDDVLIGGTEDFNPENRDRAFGGAGDDVFLWAPGDGSDFFDGGDGEQDVVAFGLISESDGASTPKQTVEMDQNFDGIFLNPNSGLPEMNVAGSPGFCEVLDASTNSATAAALAELNLDHLVRFVIRGIRAAFDRGDQNSDDGTRVTLHLRNVEYLVCGSQAGGETLVFDLRQSPPVAASISDLPANMQAILQPPNGDVTSAQ